MNTATTPTPVLWGVLFGAAEHLTPWSVLAVSVQTEPDSDRMSYCLPLENATAPVSIVRYAANTSRSHVARVKYPMRAALSDLEDGSALTYADTPVLYAEYAGQPSTFRSTLCAEGNRLPVIAHLLRRLGYSWAVTLEAYAAANMTGAAFSSWRRTATDETWAAYDVLEQASRRLHQKDTATADMLGDLLLGDAEYAADGTRGACAWANALRLEQRGAA